MTHLLRVLRPRRLGAFLAPLAALFWLFARPAAAQDGPPQEVFLPRAAKAPVVVVISGQTGMPNYRDYAQRVADLGYYTVLIDGKDILTRAQDGGQNLRTVIGRAQAAPNGMEDKAMVIAFSQGGGGALAHAVKMPELVKGAVLHYPATSWIRDLPAAVAAIRIPLLVLTGERDRYNNCCVIERMREIEALAKGREAPFDLVVYPDAEHGFNLAGRQFRADDAEDAWRRAAEMLARLHPR